MNLDFPASIPLAHVDPDHLRAQGSSANRQRSHRLARSIARSMLRCVGLRALATSACEHRRIGPKRARAPLRGRPISEKAFVNLGCKEAFENTELSPLNASVQLPGRPKKRHSTECRNAGPVGCNGWFSAATHGLGSACPAPAGSVIGPFDSAATPPLGLSAANSPICFSQE
jgi:hypothetical protein